MLRIGSGFFVGKKLKAWLLFFANKKARPSDRLKTL